MSIAEANRKCFDALTDSYDTKPWAGKLNIQLSDALRSRLDWIGVNWVTPDAESKAEAARDVRLLDYACGTGLVSRALGPYVTSTIGIDISPNMVSTYNSRASASGLPSSRISAVVGDLFAAEPSPQFSDPQFFNFDIAAVGFGYHHFDDVLLCTKRLSERLKPGGVLLISDFLQGEGMDEFQGFVNEPKNWEGHHGHADEHSQEHEHTHHHHSHIRGHGKSENSDGGQLAVGLNQELRASIKAFSFDAQGVRGFFEEAGLVDFKLCALEEKVYMEFAGEKMERTVFFARGRKPIG